MPLEGNPQAHGNLRQSSGVAARSRLLDRSAVAGKDRFPCSDFVTQGRCILGVVTSSWQLPQSASVGWSVACEQTVSGHLLTQAT